MFSPTKTVLGGVHEEVRIERQKHASSPELGSLKVTSYILGPVRKASDQVSWSDALGYQPSFWDRRPRVPTKILGPVPKVTRPVSWIGISLIQPYALMELVSGEVAKLVQRTI